MRASVFGGIGVVAVVLAGCAQPSQPPAETAATPPPPAPPYEIHTLRDLINVCRTPQTDPFYASAEGLCWGYASGVLDFYQVDTATGHRRQRVCLPTTAPTRGEAVTGLLTWADANQQFLDDSAPYGLMRFYIAQYPCQQPAHGRRPAPPRQ
jgi:hypothetical protein